MANTGSPPADVKRLRLDEHPPEEVIGDDEPGESPGNPVIQYSSEEEEVIGDDEPSESPGIPVTQHPSEEVIGDDEPRESPGIPVMQHPSEEVIGDGEPRESPGGNPVVPDNDNGSHDNPTALTSRICRICLEEATATDPIIPLGCRCRGDLSIGHRSCLWKWFLWRVWTDQNVHCEVCRGILGMELQFYLFAIIWVALHPEWRRPDYPPSSSG